MTTSQWLYRVQPTRAESVSAPTDEEMRLVGEHFDYLVALRDRGILILAGRTQEDAPFGITVFEAEDEDAARAVMDADPAIAGGFFAATLHPYAVAVARHGPDMTTSP